MQCAIESQHQDKQFLPTTVSEEKKNICQKSKADPTAKTFSILLASTSGPSSIVDNADFQAFIDSMNPRFHIPRRTGMTTDIF
ncbi:hypothetical protein OUZ56_012843 [Daphnia magna]|uniref:Uncharacterized protein n=1 Tax=Daphnia magna TaxID=35525 RepID=A0ABQ9Z5C0_9CRUS|nr:hypothetical protein OUZ56_012843 [Daphnia magna]